MPLLLENKVLVSTFLKQKCELILRQHSSGPFSNQNLLAVIKTYGADRFYLTKHLCYITPNVPCKGGWKTPLKEHWLYLQDVKLKIFLTTSWHFWRSPVPLCVKFVRTSLGFLVDTQGLS